MTCWAIGMLKHCGSHGNWHVTDKFHTCVCVSVVKERRRRQALERRTKEMERLSKQLVKQYDARFIELASEVTLFKD